MSNKENNTEQPITDISIYIAALQKTYVPAPTPADATHFFSTAEVVDAIRKSTHRQRLHRQRYSLPSAMQVSISATAVARKGWNSNGCSVRDKSTMTFIYLDVYLSGHFVVRRGVLYK